MDARDICTLYAGYYLPSFLRTIIRLYRQPTTGPISYLPGRPHHRKLTPNHTCHSTQTRRPVDSIISLAMQPASRVWTGWPSTWTIVYARRCSSLQRMSLRTRLPDATLLHAGLATLTLKSYDVTTFLQYASGISSLSRTSEV